ncbi:MAG: hypothetical protein JSS77_12930 [Acidobacteria bacterium]|nr:hypothetical protein [Acidobacteriota bacterium]
MEVGIRRIHAVHEIGQLAGQLDVRKVPSKVAHAAVAAPIDELIDVEVSSANQFQLVLGDVGVSFGESHLVNQVIATLSDLAGRRSGAAGIGSEADK